jgi:O-antigen/teichoic acid export membrane protein
MSFNSRPRVPHDSRKVAKKQTLTAHSVKGIVFFGAQTIVVKASGLIGQVVLSWLLLPEDFGLIGLAYTITAFTGLTRSIGLREFIIRRQGATFWVEPAIWLAFAIGIASSVTIVLAAPLSVWFYNEPRLPELLYVLAIAQPFSSATSVMSGVLQQRMRFKALSILAAISAILTIVFSIVLAKAGMGAYSFVLPIPIVEVACFVIHWWLVKPAFKWRPRVQVWRFFVGTSTLVLLTNLCGTVVTQGDRMLLGYFQDTQTVGIYFFAFNLATQATKFLWNSIGGILLPAFSTLIKDEPRLASAFRKTVRTIALIFVPISLLQVPLADPIIRIFFSEKWISAIPLVQVMGFSMAVHSVAEPCAALLLAQGRFATNFFLTLLWTGGFLVMVALAAKYGSVLDVAMAAAASYIIFSPVYFWVATRRLGFGVRELLQFYFAPVVMNAFSIGIGWYFVNVYELSNIATLFAIPCIASVIYIVLLFAVAGRHIRAMIKPLMHGLA